MIRWLKIRLALAIAGLVEDAKWHRADVRGAQRREIDERLRNSEEMDRINSIMMAWHDRLAAVEALVIPEVSDQ